MAEIIRSGPARADLDAIADCIAPESPPAAAALVQHVFSRVEQRADHPGTGSRPKELGRSRYRQIVEPP
ncbi:MAG: type II toxin-antitoxin system RelE/ParE family toxin [Pseudoxanthomonas sp.]